MSSSRNATRPDLGSNLKRLRRSRGWSLSRLAKEAGLPQSTLSKVEHGQMSLNYEKLLQTAEALEVDVRDLFANESEIASANGAMARRSIDKASSKTDGQHNQYDFRFLCKDLKTRLMVPMILDVNELKPDATEIPFMKVHGERFAYVLSGPVEFHCEQYQTLVLQTGDSLYVDAAMPHAFVSPGAQSAKILTIISSSDFDYLRLAREAASLGIPDATQRYNELKEQKRL